MSGYATLDWLGCATFRLSVDGLVVFLDAYVDRPPAMPPTSLAAVTSTENPSRARWLSSLRARWRCSNPGD